MSYLEVVCIYDFQQLTQGFSPNKARSLHLISLFYSHTITIASRSNCAVLFQFVIHVPTINSTGL